MPGGVEVDLTLSVEHPGHRVRGAEVAAVPAEGVADLGDRAVGVVGRGLDEDRGAARAVSLVGHLLVFAALELAGALLDGAVDVVVRHVHRLGRVDRGAQARIARRDRRRRLLAATVISRITLVQEEARLASVTAFLRLICFHLLWPAMAELLDVQEVGGDADGHCGRPGGTRKHKSRQHACGKRGT